MNKNKKNSQKLLNKLDELLKLAKSINRDVKKCNKIADKSISK